MSTSFSKTQPVGSAPFCWYNEQMSKREKPFHTACYLILLKPNQVLLSRRYNTGYEDGNYSLVAGHVESDETVRDALVREAEEEAGIQVKRDDLEFVSVLHRNTKGKRIYLDFFFKCDKWDGEPHNAEPDKCDQILWADLDNLPENVIPYVQQAIQTATGRGDAYWEIGW